MRSLWLKCLVLVVSLALVSGNAHAALSLDEIGHDGAGAEGHEHHRALAESAPVDAATHHEKAHHHDKDGCCCECLGCTTAADLASALALTPLESGVSIRFEQRADSWVGRALDPELDPPRSSAQN